MKVLIELDTNNGDDLDAFAALFHHGPLPESVTSEPKSTVKEAAKADAPPPPVADAPPPPPVAEDAPPPPPAAAETVPPPSAVTADLPPTVKVDSAGVRFDPEIHATSSETGEGIITSNGTWRKRRGVSPETVASRQVVVDVPNNDAPPPPPAATTAAPPPPAAGGAITAGNVNPFALVVARVAGLKKNGMPQEELDSILQESTGLRSLPELATRKDLIPALNAALDALGA